MTRARARLAGLVAATFVAASGLVGLTQGPAAAALCSGKGVNVVVDFHGLGGGVQKGCDPSGANKAASSVFRAAGFSLTYAQRQPGFVCRVNGKPANDPCVNTSPQNAYWGLYWSDGRSGKWTYASQGAGSLRVPDGGFVAFSWQNGGANDPPGASPVGVRPSPTPKASPKPTPKPSPKPKPTKKPTHAATAAPTAKSSVKASATPSVSGLSTAQSTARSSASAPASPNASASPFSTASPGASTSASVVPPTASDSASPAAAAQTNTQLTSAKPDTGGLPLWVPGAVVVALGAGTGGALWWRRRSGA